MSVHWCITILHGYVIENVEEKKIADVYWVHCSWPAQWAAKGGKERIELRKGSRRHTCLIRNVIAPHFKTSVVVSMHCSLNVCLSTLRFYSKSDLPNDNIFIIGLSTLLAILMLLLTIELQVVDDESQWSQVSTLQPKGENLVYFRYTTFGAALSSKLNIIQWRIKKRLLNITKSTEGGTELRV